MKNLFHFVMAITVMAVFAGCGASTKEMARMGQSEKTDVFTEIVSEGPAPTGYADIAIRASVKIPLAGGSCFGSKEPEQGKTVYPYLINIDGQAVLWRVEGQKHLVPEFVNGETNHDPEAGEGWKYVLEKKLRVAAGSHTVFLGLPDKPYGMTADISVKSGGSYVLEFKPDYRYKTHPTRIPSFSKGLYQFEVLLTELAVQAR